MQEPSISLREAELEDVPTLEALIRKSIHTLGARDYTPEQIEAALRGAFGVDTQLIKDRTYFVIEEDGEVVACGGWSRRRTLFGSDTGIDRDSTELDPEVDPAKIRAFFVAPEHARRGLGRLLLERCEAAAKAAGFTRFELMATLPGARLYSALGYEAQASLEYPLENGLTITFVPMKKVTSV